jgi:hypothetical protein
MCVDKIQAEGNIIFLDGRETADQGKEQSRDMRKVSCGGNGQLVEGMLADGEANDEKSGINFLGFIVVAFFKVFLC